MTQKISPSGLNWLVALAAISTSCGGGGSSAPLTTADFCMQKATRECTGIAANCGASMTACQAKRLAACTTFVNAIQASVVVRPFRPENIANCVNMAQSVYSKATITPADLAPLDTACNRVFSGKLAVNAACMSSDYECDVGLICDPVLLVCAKQTVVTGMYCGNPGETCPTGKSCTAPAGGGTRQCTARAGSGESCSDATPCLETLRCDATSMKCATKAAVSEACTTDDDCAASAPYCDPAGGNTCDAGFQPTRFNPQCADFGATVSGAGGAGGAAI